MSPPSALTEQALKKLNREFQSDTLSVGPVHSLLRQLGVVIESSVIFECFPDSGRTFVLRMVGPDSAVYEADLDADNPDECKLEVIGSFPRGGKRRTQTEDAAIQVILDEVRRA